MVMGLIASAFGGVLLVGFLALIVSLQKRRELKKHTSGLPMEVRFRPRGLFGVSAFVFSVWAGVWIVLFLSMKIDLPTWVFSIGFVFFLGAVHPYTVKAFGEMFVVCGAGEETPSRSFAPSRQDDSPLPMQASTAPPGYYIPEYPTRKHTTEEYNTPDQNGRNSGIR